MNILVTGAAGFIGYSFLNKYLDTPDLKKKVIGIDNIKKKKFFYFY